MFLIVGCSTDSKELQKRGETYYKINSETPFSSSVIGKYESGEKYFKGSFKDGREEGIWNYWYRDGQKKEERSYTNGKKDGLETTWYDNGQRRSEIIYVGGEKEIFKSIWSDDGSLEISNKTYKVLKKEWETISPELRKLMMKSNRTPSGFNPDIY